MKLLLRETKVIKPVKNEAAKIPLKMAARKDQNLNHRK